MSETKARNKNKRNESEKNEREHNNCLIYTCTQKTIFKILLYGKPTHTNIYLTLSQTTNCRVFEIERVCRRQFEI